MYEVVSFIVNQDYGLVDRVGRDLRDPTLCTASERQQRNVDRKKLRQLRHEQQRHGKRRKVLKVEEYVS